MFGKHEGFHGRSFGPAHIGLLLVTLGLTGLAVYLTRKCKQKTFRRMYIGACCFLVVSEIIKWTWDGMVLKRIDFASTLPMYICSITMFVIPLALLCKGSVRQAALGHIATLNIIGAVAGVVFSTVILKFPFFHLNVINSFLYHAVLLFVGITAWTSKLYRPTVKDLGLFFLPCLVMAIPVIACDMRFGWDYMFLNKGFDTPFSILSRVLPQPVYIMVMLLGYYAVTVALFYIPTIVRAVRHRARPIATPESLWVEEANAATEEIVAEKANADCRQE